MNFKKILSGFIISSALIVSQIACEPVSAHGVDGGHPAFPHAGTIGSPHYGVPLSREIYVQHDYLVSHPVIFNKEHGVFGYWFTYNNVEIFINYPDDGYNIACNYWDGNEWVPFLDEDGNQYCP